MQTRATYGLSGVGFLDSQNNAYIGFSVTAARLNITGGHEVVMQKNSPGVAVAAFNQIGDVTVEIEGITDATAAFIARLKGGTLKAGTGALPSALRPTTVLPAQWSATTVVIASNRAPLPGAYAITKGTTDTVQRLFAADGSTIIGAAEGVDATADFTITTIPSVVSAGDVGYFFVEPITSVEAGEYVFGSLNVPGEVTVVGMTQDGLNTAQDNRNLKRIFVPRMQLNPIDENNASNEFSALGTVSGMALHDADLGGVYSVGYNYGIS